MKDRTLLIALTFLALAFVSCSKHPPAGTYHERLANLSTQHTNITTQAQDRDTILPGRHMSEQQVVDIASRELPQGIPLRCEFRDGVWHILEVQKNVWGISSATTNADGKVFITSTNPTRIVLKVHDTDGQVEQVKKP
jgi:hypothetical protein